MNTKFVKGILLMAAVLLTAYQQENVIWAGVIITAICTGIIYYTKNYLMSSTSVEGELNWKDLLSAAILAIAAGISSSISSIVVDGAINWTTLGREVIAIVVTYFSTTFFSGTKTK